MTLAFEREVRLEGLDALAQDLLKRVNHFPNICLYGDLGAGKTTLVKELCKQLHIDSKEVTSPTFTYMQTYGGFNNAGRPVEVHHFDLYRLEAEEDFESMGWLEYFQMPTDREPLAVTLIEWPSKIKTYLPKPRLDVKLDYFAESSRKVSVYERV